MATHTTNYNLSKPESTDAFSAFRQSYNDNMDIIDANLGGGGGGGSVNDVEVNGVSVVVGGVAEVTVPTQTSDLVNDSDFVSDASYVHTDNNFTTALKDKLDGIESGAEVNVQADWNEADSTADDFIKNKPSIPSATSDLVNDSGFLTSSDVSAVAMSGDYDDLLNKPSIPTELSDLNNDEGFTATSWNQIQATGTKIAEIDIDGNTTDVYAPTGGGSGDSVSWNQIQASGTKIAEIDINGTVTDVYAPSGAPAFSALIIVTADTGQTVTASKGGDTYTATEVTPGTYEVTVDSLGIWTISDGTLSDTVTITAQGVYYVTLSAVPDGKTVTPTDDIQIWLNCADIWDKTYTTLSEVLADSTTLSALMADNNAVDYLVRSTTWASGITADSSAMSYIGLNNYASNTLLDDSTWNTAIQNSTYFESVDNVKVPVMTSNTTPSGQVFYSGQHTSQLGYMAFNGSNANGWVAPKGATNNYDGYDFQKNVSLKKSYIRFIYGNGAPAGITFYIQGSSDGTNYDNLASFTTQSGVTEYTQIVSVSNNYRYFRLFTPSVIAQSGTGSTWYYNTVIIQFYCREDI